MAKNKEFVKFDNVDKSYDGKVLVVKGLNLDIEAFQRLLYVWNVQRYRVVWSTVV